MRKDEFISELAQLLGVEPDELKPETELETIDSWDSVAYLSTMVLIDEKLGITIRPEVISQAKTIADLLSAVQSRFEG